MTQEAKFAKDLKPGDVVGRSIAWYTVVGEWDTSKVPWVTGDSSPACAYLVQYQDGSVAPRAWTDGGFHVPIFRVK